MRIWNPNGQSTYTTLQETYMPELAPVLYEYIHRRVSFLCIIISKLRVDMDY
jgi:hypothetical protein